MSSTKHTAKPLIELSVYDGSTLVGVLRERGKRVEALAITGNQRRRIGTFKTRREAMRAIPRTCEQHISK